MNEAFALPLTLALSPGGNFSDNGSGVCRGEGTLAGDVRGVHHYLLIPETQRLLFNRIPKIALARVFAVDHSAVVSHVVAHTVDDDATVA